MQLVLLFSTKPVRKTKKITFCSPLINHKTVARTALAMPGLSNSIFDSELLLYFPILPRIPACQYFPLVCFPGAPMSRIAAGQRSSAAFINTFSPLDKEKSCVYYVHVVCF